MRLSHAYFFSLHAHNRAGELISTVAVAIQNGLHVRELALTIQPSSSYAYALHKVWVLAATRMLYANLQYVYMYVYPSLKMYVCTYEYIYIYIYVCVCVCVCVCGWVGGGGHAQVVR
jgi:hypothetical protein